MKAPAFQFYPADWRKDPGVQALDFFSRGVWIEILCLMHESNERGVLLLNGAAMPEEALANILGLDKQNFDDALTKIKAYGVAKVRQSDGALYSKRMVDDEKLTQIRRNAGNKGGNPALLKQNSTTQDKQNPTPSSSSSSSLKAPPIVPQGGQGPSDESEKPKRKKRDRQTFKAWAESLPAGEKAIPEDHRVFRYANEIGLPDEFVALAWVAFKRSFWESKKTQADWRQHFFNAVQGNWGKLWFASDDGGYGLTTAGIQLQRSVSGSAQ